MLDDHLTIVGRSPSSTHPYSPAWPIDERTNPIGGRAEPNLQHRSPIVYIVPRQCEVFPRGKDFFLARRTFSPIDRHFSSPDEDWEKDWTKKSRFSWTDVVFWPFGLVFWTISASFRAISLDWASFGLANQQKVSKSSEKSRLRSKSLDNVWKVSPGLEKSRESVL